jgi:phage-related protein
MNVKELKFAGLSLDDLRNFPEEARRVLGCELCAVQNGLAPFTCSMPFRKRARRQTRMTSTWLANDSRRLEAMYEGSRDQIIWERFY